MTEKFAVFIDIDNTLTDDNGINPKNAEIIDEARKAGHYIFVNTGRAKSWINSELIGHINLDGIISGMGSRIEIGEKVIFEKTINQDFVYSCAKHFWNTENCFFISGVQKGFILNPIPYFKQWDFIDIESPEDINGKYKDEKIQKLEMFGKNITEDDKIFFGKELNLYDHGGYIECASRGCTKSTAMDIVLNHLGLKKENSIAIGDSVNDMDMLKNAGIAVAVGNAIDDVKKIADFVSTPCADGGVGYAIEQLVINK
ncbi:MAG: Cof-type HAD-IIB family hydrolase [Firmicutes bacterium]|nr:Cof-type HAD-IIB family hydrolase [Bacillota bacterium]